MNKKTAVGVLVAVAWTASACRIATVRPLDGGESPESSAATPLAGDLDTSALADSIWQEEVPGLLDTAADAGTVARRGIVAGPVVVRGDGRVVEADLRTRTGAAVVELDGKVGTRVLLQIGPVLSGTAIRDAIPALAFDRFVNQIQHAEVANELNARVERDILGSLARQRLRGRRVSFAGMAVAEPAGPIVVTPVRLEVEAPR